VWKEISEALENDISTTNNLKDKMAVIAKYAKAITDADRCSIFLIDKEKDRLHSVYADGIKGSIVLRSNAGIAGYAFHKKISIIENDPHSSLVFLKAVDLKSGYQTQTILAVPIIDKNNNNRLGVIQLLNKKDGFTKTDQSNIEYLTAKIVKILNTENKTFSVEVVDGKGKLSKEEEFQKKLDQYLVDKKLFFMDDGNVYYKILNMIREYYIAADKCYLLEYLPQKIPLYYFTTSDEFLSIDMYIKIDKNLNGLLISTNENNEFELYPLEED
jgi:hypothetical protein